MELVILSIIGFIAGIGLGHLKHKYLGTAFSAGTGVSSSSKFDYEYDDGFTVDAEFHHVDDAFSSSCSSVNPATGLIMIGDCMVDVAGNPYGVDMSDSLGSGFGDSIDWH